MNMIDFDFNGETLSDHNMMVGYISSADESTPLGSPANVNTVKVDDTNRITFVNYEEPITKTFSVVKNACTDFKSMFFTEDEIYEVSTWLQPKNYHKFHPIYDDGSFDELFFFGRFDVNAVYINGQVAGFELTFTANAPYGFGRQQETSYIIDENKNTFRVFNDSQEYGYTYFDEFKITCGSDGTFSMENDNDVSVETGHKYLTRIDNCVANEVITINCKDKIITTNNLLHEDTLYEDFNWNFPRLVCDYINPLNVFTINTGEMENVTIDIKFTPVRKVGVI